MLVGLPNEDTIVDRVKKLERQWEDLRLMRERADVSPEEVLDALSILAATAAELNALTTQIANSSEIAAIKEQRIGFRLVKK
ncbi:hypothetical protein M2401_006853 [Pseudomonas sp. JUb42]|uniref:hypothetical protein n=1 Tax=Pseudomonas sp. JUb42 TaxID=2940611 RepID=UPI00216995EE|nr:hypothetical protein [Pseudomonas sp. JUb42]MCS3473085.1 hypothetical protein [Pseudomonas sp. JUb42]